MSAAQTVICNFWSRRFKSMNEKFSDCPQIRQRLTETRIGSAIAAAPQVSVIIPAYNITPYIKETLDSVFAQTYENFEVVLVNDGSQDTRELEIALKPYFDKIVYGKQANSGASLARNAAICLARGELLAFLDGDDIWKPEFLASSVDFLEKNDLEMVYCDAELFGAQLFAGRTFMQDAPSKSEVNTLSLINAECNVITSGTLIKKELTEKFDLFDTNLPRMQDFDLWFRFAKNGARIGFQTDVLIKYRVRPNSLSGTNVNRAERNIRALNVINDKYDLNEREKTVWHAQMALCEAELELEKGKLCLVQGDFSEAQTHIVKANKFYRKPKLSLLTMMMSISPQLALTLFKKIRPAEFSFISPDKS